MMVSWGFFHGASFGGSAPWTLQSQTLPTSGRCAVGSLKGAIASPSFCRAEAALGAYQAGVFQALSEADIEPDWVTGVSIGAINSAIIAGNSKQWRLKRLRTFWERITERKIWSYTPDGDVFRKARNAASSWMTLIQGQPGFFSPRHPTPWFSLAGWSISRCSTKRQCAFRWAR